MDLCVYGLVLWACEMIRHPEIPLFLLPDDVAIKMKVKLDTKIMKKKIIE